MNAPFGFACAIFYLLILVQAYLGGAAGDKAPSLWSLLSEFDCCAPL
jgi:hypothetical protein